jgi:hypothetical protein
VKYLVTVSSFRFEPLAFSQELSSQAKEVVENYALHRFEPVGLEPNPQSACHINVLLKTLDLCDILIDFPSIILKVNLAEREELQPQLVSGGGEGLAGV